MKITWTPTRRRAAFLGAWLVATLLLVWCARSVDWSRTAEVLATTRPWWLVAAVVANAAILPLMAAFWMALRPATEKPVSFARLLEIASTATAMMNTLPFGGGHASLVVLLVKRGDTSQRGALSILALDQLGEGLAKLAVFLTAGLLLPLPEWMRSGVTTAALLVSALFVGVIVASRWATELQVMKSWSRSTAALASVLGTKVVEALAIVAVQRAFGVDVSMSGTILVLAATILGSMLPVTPANVGTYEAGVFVAYRYLGLSPEQALSLALLQHVCFLLPSVGVGYLIVSAQTLSRSAMASR